MGTGPRLKDIARDLGVSVMTVSKALRGHSDIGQETRERVLEHAKGVGYSPNRIAQSLVTRRSYLIGLVVPDLMHSFFAEIAGGVTKVIEPHGYQLVIANSDERIIAEVRQLELLLSRRVDGLIVASSQVNGDHEIFEQLARSGTAFVQIDRQVPGLNAPFVGVEDHEIGRMATTHLLDEGARRIAHIRGPEVRTGIQRMQGYLSVLAERGIPVEPELIVPGYHTDAGGRAAMMRLLELPNRPDAVFAYNDPTATGAIQAILESGLRIPADIAVAGAGNVHYSDLLRVRLTTVDQSSQQIGERAAQILIENIESGGHSAAQTVVFPPRLIVRESSRRSQ